MGTIIPRRHLTFKFRSVANLATKIEGACFKKEKYLVMYQQATVGEMMKMSKFDFSSDWISATPKNIFETVLKDAITL